MKYRYGIPPFQSPEGWGKPAKVTNLVNKNKQLIGIKVEKSNGEKFVVPVLDVRVDRRRAEVFIYRDNISKGSKFFKPSYSLRGPSYN